MSTTLPEAQAEVLSAAGRDKHRSIIEVAEAADLKPDAATGAAYALEERGFLDVRTETETEYTLTDEGREYVRNSLPELRFYEAAMDADADKRPVPMGEVIGAAGLEDDAVDIALANYARKGYGTVESGEVSATPDASPRSDREQRSLDALADRIDGSPDEETLDRLVSRGLVSERTETEHTIKLTDSGAGAVDSGIEVAERVDRLTPELLTSGEWQDVEFAEYNVEARADTVNGGRKHVLRQMADRVKSVLVGMGFTEMEGPQVDADFYINDCLFMPQDHPARNHWDRFAMDQPETIDELPAELVERVEQAHREGVGPDGEGYHSPWEEDFARALALRGHTTSLSARYLTGVAGADIDPPERYFSVEKAYRNDTLDATHLLEFYQIEGWVMAEELSVRDLMGTFREFYEQFGITDLQFKPTYNPYTEPSFELFGHHPETGELIEIGNSGIFRPEMLEPMDIEADIMAWGLALERLLMLATGAEDIRDVHGTLVDLEFLRDGEVIY